MLLQLSCTYGRNKGQVQCNAYIGFFHQNYNCTCDICRSHGEVTTPCTGNSNIVNGVKNMCVHILCPKGGTNEFHKL